MLVLEKPPENKLAAGLHLLNLQALQMHATDDVGEERHHVVITHSHIGDNLLERNLLARIVFVLLSTAVQLET